MDFKSGFKSKTQTAFTFSMVGYLVQLWYGVGSEVSPASTWYARLFWLPKGGLTSSEAWMWGGKERGQEKGREGYLGWHGKWKKKSKLKKKRKKVWRGFRRKHRFVHISLIVIECWAAGGWDLCPALLEDLPISQYHFSVSLVPAHSLFIHFLGTNLWIQL